MDKNDVDHNEPELSQIVKNRTLTYSPKVYNKSSSNKSKDAEEHSIAVAEMLTSISTNNSNSVEMINSIVKLTKALKCVETPVKFSHIFLFISYF